MSRFEDLRGYLPVLYRPEDDDPTGQVQPFAPEAILSINDAPVPGTVTLSTSGLRVVVDSGETPLEVRRVRLNTAWAAGGGLFLEFFRFDNPTLIASRPVLSVPLDRGLAVLPPTRSFTGTRFALQVRRVGLFSRFIKGAADALDQANLETQIVLQAHWFTYADSGLFHPYAVTFRDVAGQKTPPPGDLSLQLFPYLHDLARLSALMSLTPWQDPPALRELVEQYRRRVARIIALYRNGLGTIDALRSITEAYLPPLLPAADLTPEQKVQFLERQDRPFWIEEFSTLLEGAAQPIHMPGPTPQSEMVGPLMRWQLTNDGLAPAAPTIYIQGVAPVGDKIDATTDPILELYSAPDGLKRVGIGFRGTLAPTETLRLRPAGASWLARADGLHSAESLPTDDAPADPTAPGPWTAVAIVDTPIDPVSALVQTADMHLYVATNGELGVIWRFNGEKWEAVLKEEVRLNCLLEAGEFLLVGTSRGVVQMPLYSSDPPTFVEGTEEINTLALFRDGDGLVWIGTETGLLVSTTPVSAAPLQNVAVNAITSDPRGTVYLGTALGLFLYQPGFNDWYFYEGKTFTDQAQDWQKTDLSALPGAGEVFLPPVLSLCYGPDQSLWIGTERGLARYRARAVGAGSLTYTTLLEAFPDLIDGPVTAIRVDERGLMWFATSRGLFRYDGRDLWQHQGEVWVLKGHADNLYRFNVATPEVRGAWRFNRTLTRWERANAAGVFVAFTDAVRSTAEPAVTTFTWVEQVAADLGIWDGTAFTSSSPVPMTSLFMRVKPDEATILNGGIPGIPRLPVGASTWRYLQLEQGDPPAFKSAPAWTHEGRFIPPPPDRDAPPPGRYDGPEVPPPISDFDVAVWAYNPAARVWFRWYGHPRLHVLVRLKLYAPDEALDPVIVGRIREGIELVRPAGVRVQLAVEEKLVQ